jgi:hypothetical protein
MLRAGSRLEVNVGVSMKIHSKSNQVKSSYYSSAINFALGIGQRAKAQSDQQQMS